MNFTRKTKLSKDTVHDECDTSQCIRILQRKAKKMNKIKICGTKPSTAPTPATIPSMIRPLNQSAQFAASRADSKNAGIPGIQMP